MRALFLLGLIAVSFLVFAPQTHASSPQQIGCDPQIYYFCANALHLDTPAITTK